MVKSHPRGNAIPRVGIVGAGIGGLTAAIELALKGMKVEIFERASVAGGKLRETRLEDQGIDAGPTVFTWPEIFERLFIEAGDNFAQRVPLTRARILARHAWADGSVLDLHADPRESRAAIAAFAGREEARAFERFMTDAAQIFALLEHTYMRAARPTLPGLMAHIGLGRPQSLWRLKPFSSLHGSLAHYFRDPRLRQLFARYATYCGSSPYQCPATLMLIAHLEQRGVWYLKGGMTQLASALVDLANRLGCVLHTNAEVVAMERVGGRIGILRLRNGECVAVDAVVSNADNGALAAGCFGVAARHAVAALPVRRRSLSAVTTCTLARVEGFTLAHHNVFFSRDYRQEFDDLFRRRQMPAEPTVYVCAQDRTDSHLDVSSPTERLFCLTNAPATGDHQSSSEAETHACTQTTLRTLERFGLKLTPKPGCTVTCTPAEFNRLFPATGGALYGPATHGWRASFLRPGARSRIPGLYLAGGSTHPGPGLPMAALSGRLAAESICQDLLSTSRFPGTAIAGGTSME